MEFVDCDLRRGAYNHSRNPACQRCCPQFSHTGNPEPVRPNQFRAAWDIEGYPRPMSAYVIVDTKISDPDAYEDYKAKAGGLVEKYEGTYLARGGELEVVEDDLWSPTRIVIVEFADMEAARGFVHSEEYEPVAALRHANADCTVIIVDGT